MIRMIKSTRIREALVGKLEGKRPLGRQRCRQVDKIKMDLRWGGVV
jgi:hypothetical protein